MRFVSSLVGSFCLALVALSGSLRAEPVELELVLMADASGSIDAQRVLDFDRPTSELEGLLWMEPNRNDEIPFIMVSAQREQNVHLGRRMPPKRFVNPIQRQLNR